MKAILQGRVASRVRKPQAALCSTKIISQLLAAGHSPLGHEPQAGTDGCPQCQLQKPAQEGGRRPPSTARALLEKLGQEQEGNRSPSQGKSDLHAGLLGGGRNGVHSTSPSQHLMA